ncbi:SIMPL domain-containing protein [Thalassococcus sp. CAU 1522]|uniref:SIMPL domain-containing protein n=2 Tax=Thalassococcus arenae TaxID=2851652 RepID=A0ABS6N8W4_9RHOB|nr:SIMPL domain-containing protein [Thalassococcus arenae]
MLVSLALVTPAMAQSDESARLTVTGQGEAFAAPDMATVTLGMTAQADAADAAMQQVSAVVDAILARLDAFGIAAADRQTSDLSLGPIYGNRQNDEGGRDIVGFQAYNRLTVRVRNLDDLGDVLSAVLDDGANQLDGLSFGVQDPRPVLDAARRDAVADARAKAELFAEAAGVTLGPVLSLTEGGGQTGPFPEMMSMARGADAVPVAAGEATFSASVMMVFALGN